MVALSGTQADWNSLTPFTYVGFEGHWTREKEARRAQAGHKKLARSSAQKCYGELNAAIVRNMVLARGELRVSLQHEPRHS